MDKVLQIFMKFLYSFNAIGAIVAGTVVIINPSGQTMGVSTDMLKGAPFDTFLIPGIILCFVVGLSHALSAYMLFTNGAPTKTVLICTALILTIWMAVQIYMIGYSSIIQGIYLVITVVEIFLSLSYKYVEI